MDTFDVTWPNSAISPSDVAPKFLVRWEWRKDVDFDAMLAMLRVHWTRELVVLGTLHGCIPKMNKCFSELAYTIAIGNYLRGQEEIHVFGRSCLRNTPQRAFSG